MAKPIQNWDSSSLLQLLTDLGGERALLTESDAPEEELHTVQQRIDAVTQELGRRICW